MKKEDKKPAVEYSEEVKVDPNFDPASASVDPGEKSLGAIGYFSILCILPLILRPKSEFCLFHGKQSLAMILAFIPFKMLGYFIGIWSTSGLLVVSFLFFWVQLYGAWQAWNGKMTEIPVFSGISKKLLLWGAQIADTYGGGR